MMIVRNVLALSLLALSACASNTKSPVATAPATTAAPVSAPTPAADGPPTEDGIYTYGDCEGEGGCPNRHWRAKEPATLLAQRRSSAKVIATVTPGEWVSVERVETRIVPLRGVAHEATADWLPGQVVYQLEYEGEGYSTYWSDGKQVSLDTPPKVEWEAAPALPLAMTETLGLWAKVQREKDGQVGWLYEPKFECMGKLAGDENCRD